MVGRLVAVYIAVTDCSNSAINPFILLVWHGRERWAGLDRVGRDPAAKPLRVSFRRHTSAAENDKEGITTEVPSSSYLNEAEFNAQKYY